MKVRVKTDLFSVQGTVVKAGAVLRVHREYTVNGGRQRRVELVDETGCFVMGSVDPEDLEVVE